MLLQDAAVHDHENSRLSRLFSGTLVNYLFLHPDRGYLQLDRLIDDRFDKFRATEDIHYIDRFLDLQQRGIRLLAKGLINFGIHRNNSIAVRLHVG